jgi:hypothetical protein
MSKDSANRQANAIDPQPVTPESKKQAAERRRQDALEDDEVYEALRSLHAQKETRSGD